MRVYILMGILGALLVTAGCTWGLTEEEAKKVREYKRDAADKRAQLKVVQGRIEALTEKLTNLPPDTPLWKAALAERDELVATGKELTSVISGIVQKTKDLEKQGVPGWSVALNVLLQAAGYIFGVGGVGAALVGRIKNKTLKGVATTLIGVVEKDLTPTTAKTVKKAIKEKATSNGAETALNALVKETTEG